MEVTTKVEIVQVDFECPKCFGGYLRQTGVCLTSHPPQYPHKCDNLDCDYGETFTNKQYPYLSTILKR